MNQADASASACSHIQAQFMHSHEHNTSETSYCGKVYFADKSQYTYNFRSLMMVMSDDDVDICMHMCK